MTMTGPDPELILLHIRRSLYGEPYPEAYRKILMSSVLALASAAELHQTLTKDYAGFEGCQNTVDNWLKAARLWMGFPKTRKEVRETMPAWIAINGQPTINDIREGWVPLHHRPQGAGTIPAPTPTTNSSPAPAPAPEETPAPAPVNAPENPQENLVKSTKEEAPAPVPAKKKSKTPAVSAASAALEKLAPLVDFTNAPETGPFPDSNLDQNSYEKLMGPIFDKRREFIRNANELQGPAEGQNALRRNDLFLELVKQIPLDDPDYYATRCADLTLILREDAINISRGRWITETHNARMELKKLQSAASS
jgi:hypothetical protein